MCWGHSELHQSWRNSSKQLSASHLLSVCPYKPSTIVTFNTAFCVTRCQRYVSSLQCCSNCIHLGLTMYSRNRNATEQGICTRRTVIQPAAGKRFNLLNAQWSLYVLRAVQHSEILHSAHISLYNINWLVFTTERDSVYRVVRTQYLNTLQHV